MTSTYPSLIPRRPVRYAEYQSLPPMALEPDPPRPSSQSDQTYYLRLQQPIPRSSEKSESFQRSAAPASPLPLSPQVPTDAPPPYSAVVSETPLWSNPSPTITSAITAATTEESRPALPPRRGSADPSFNPCVIPQTSKTIHGRFYRPFARAYSPDLATLGISSDDFLAFIDGLNEAWLASPYIQTGAQVGQLIGLMPSWECQVAAVGIQAAAEYGVMKISKTRTNAYLKVANRKLFQPHGLHAQVLQTPEMMTRIGAPETKLESLPDQVDTAEIQGGDPRIRRIEALKDYVMPLNFDVQPPALAKSKSWVAKAAEKQENWFAERQNRKLMERRQKAQSILAEAEEEHRLANKDIAQLDEQMARLRVEADQKILSLPDNRKGRKKRSKVEHELKRELDKLKGKGQAVDRREERVAQKVMWVVITKDDGNVYQDDAIGMDWERHELP
ncbi:hypothetical protein VTN96DRAFT_9450 [Rasamsonia emersonii]